MIALYDRVCHIPVYFFNAKIKITEPDTKRFSKQRHLI